MSCDKEELSGGELSSSENEEMEEKEITIETKTPGNNNKQMKHNIKDI